ncbi:MAG: hypothetical protein HYX60_10780 [Legionella longbeachae]|nr:hypothetical protein [Legionella longbeachae]
MKVVLLGAGASKSYSQSPTKIRMPIAKDFFRTFNQLQISNNPWVLIGDIIVYLCETKKLQLHEVEPYLNSGIDIEDLHSEIETARDEWLKEPSKFGFSLINPYKAYNQLLFLFASVINEVQNGPISLAHINIASFLGKNDAVITFNWDTLIDKALNFTKKWNVDSGYGLTPNRIYRDGWKVPKRTKNNAPVLIKLHGSTNWLTSHSIIGQNGSIEHSHDAEPGMVNIFEYTNYPYTCYKGRYMEGYNSFAYGYYPPNLQDVKGKRAPKGRTIVSLYPKFPWTKDGSAPSHGLISMPLIIPPVKNKKYEFFGSLFKSLWLQAEEFLFQAKKIIIIGYSFPPTDVQSDQLFKQAFIKRTTMPDIVIVDPCPEKIVEKFKFEYGISESHIKVVKEYFTEHIDLSKL